MTPAATVIVPTHDHGPMLALAVRSALAQTVADVEVVIVGDGATQATPCSGIMRVRAGEMRNRAC